MNSVANYHNFRDFLKDHYQRQKESGQGFTYAGFSKKAGIRSPNYYKLVMDGHKRLTEENLKKFIKALELTHNEARFFENLVKLNQAKDSDTKEATLKRLHEIRKKLSPARDTERDLTDYEFELINHWIPHAIMVLTNFKRFKEDPSWLANALYGLVSPEEAKKMLELLLRLGLLERDASGRLRQTKKQVRTRPGLERMKLKLFFEKLFTRASQSQNLSQPDETSLYTYIVGLSPEQIPELKRRVGNFLDSLNDWALENSNPKKVYALTFAGFPLSKED